MNCKKGNLACPGYPPRHEWGEKRLRTPSARNNQQTVVAQPRNDVSQMVPTDYHLENFDHEFFTRSTLGPPLEEAQDLDNQLVISEFSQLNNTDFSDLQFEGDFTYPQEISHFLEIDQRTSLSFEIPHIFIGVDTPIQRRLFDHFKSSTSTVLTTSSGPANPFISIVLPLAVRDETLMKTLLSLAGSQLLKQCPPGSDPEIQRETVRLHHQAHEEQYQRVEILKERFPDHPSEYMDQDLEVIFATYLVLCLYEICEGSGDGSGNEHLASAGRIITLASTPPPDFVGPPPLHCSLRAKIHPFLLEFYLYHVILATVTVPSTPVVLPQYEHITHILGQDKYVVGVHDGLIKFVARISSLRNYADKNAGKADMYIVETAFQIFEELEAWKPQAASSHSEYLVANFYKMALYIWLFSIINPDRKDHWKVQDNVRCIVTGMCEIRPGDGVKACMLFPLFVAATAAVRKEDRSMIIVHFETLKKWSALGNIDLTLRAVEKLWEHHEAGVKNSWNWVKQLKGSQMSLLVT
ncbi:fungal-specific transcription factor domain-containing protein [Rhexocercosporidium sp. MPI-PUGE-AT-0058]|nr:fungal-specific transcription factor domain-containing protein [Rhexocercosporidium sp. MPI-PUGE-AT-0058]